ncbi:MAG: hypothetical protein NC244_07710 [Alistipes senegalensis]|nr:hypothetical protein [Alistipes senegalensis]
METIIESLPYFIICIALGFIFLRTFRHMCTIKNSDNHEHIIWESLFVGFILKNGFSLFPFSISQAADIVGMVISTFVLAILFAKMYSSPKIDYLFRKIGVYRTRNDYIWKDLEDSDYATRVKVINPDTQEAYFGVLKYYEEYERHPQIVLQYFQYWKNVNDNEPAKDFSNDPQCITLIDTEKFSQIFIVYTSQSSKVINKDEKKPKKNKANKDLPNKPKQK